MFATRSNDAEIMDDFGFRGEVMDRTLKEIETINRLLGGNGVTIGAFRKVFSTLRPERTYKIADLGCGSGEMLKLISALARRQKLKVDLLGVDANDYVVKYAEKHCAGSEDIRFRTANVLDENFAQETYDIITCTLFLHHFTDEELVILLQRLKARTKVAVVVNDLHRHWLAYHSINLLTRVFSRSYMVQNDARLSVLRSFRKAELEKVLKMAGFRKYEIRWKWAFRYQVILWCDDCEK